MNNDLISREALKKAISDNGYSHYFEILKIIDNAPTVEPQKVLFANVTFDKDQLDQLVQDRVIEPIKNGELVLQTDERPHGEWVRDNYGDVFCSNCGVECAYNEEGLYSLGRFCHHCGADMRKGDET